MIKKNYIEQEDDKKVHVQLKIDATEGIGED